MKVAIVHYWLKTMRGGEKVVERLCQLFPEADLFTHVFRPDRVSAVFARHRVEESYIGRLPFAARLCESAYLPLTPRALTGFDLTPYDLVISSEAAPAKGVITRPDALHICYCHSPMRFLWDHLHLYRRAAGPITRAGLDLFGPSLRRWDMASAALVDRFIANSTHTRRRIAKIYRRPASVVFPPVDLSAFRPTGQAGTDYLFVGALTAYKRADLAIEAFRLLGPEFRLTVVGEGEEAARLRASAPGNVRFAGRLDDAALAEAYGQARALIFPGEEDFGIVPLEAMAAGRPVVAYRAGGALDTVKDGETGVFFERPVAVSLVEAIRRVEARGPDGFDPGRIRAHAETFAPERFDAQIMAEVNAGLDA